MIRFLFIVGIVAVSGIVNSASARQSDLNESSDSIVVFLQWMESLPDSAKASVPADSLKGFFFNCIYGKYASA